MKKALTGAWLATWVSGILPGRAFGIGKKTPWYQKSWMQFAPWAGGALMAPFVLFLAWKGVRLMRSGSNQTAQ